MAKKPATKLIRLLAGLPFALVVIVLSVANRQTVSFHFSPLPFDIEVPLYLLSLAMLSLGALLGGAAAWLGGGKWRRLARNERRRAARREKELLALGGAAISTDERPVQGAGKPVKSRRLMQS